MRLHHATPSFLLATLGSTAMGLGAMACGSKTPETPAAPAPLVAEAPAAPIANPHAEAPPVAPPTEASTVAAPAEAPPIGVSPPLAEAPSLPGWWSPLFLSGHKSTWEVKVHTKTLDPDTDPTEDAVYIEEDKVGELKCEVASVERLDGGLQKATVICEGEVATGSGATPAGTWLTDGARVWIPSEGELPDQLTFPAEPAAKKWQLGEEEEVEIVYAIAAGKDAGAWCFSAVYQMGDGGSSEVCFATDKGPYLFETSGGSADQDITVSIRLK